MAQITGTLDTYQTNGKAEDFRNAIYTIAVQDKPFLSLIGSEATAKAKKHQWQTDTLRTPAANKQIEGDDVSFTVPAATTAVGNYLQISREQVIVTGTDQAVKLYGRASEMRRLLTKKASELTRDMELTNVGLMQASAVGSSSVAAQSGSFGAWLATNVSRGATGANGGYNTGTGLVNAPTDGTTRAFTEALYKAVMQSCHQNGAQPTYCMMAPTHKLLFSAFAGIAVNRVDQSRAEVKKSQAVILAGADVYQGDFGLQTIVSNPYMSTTLGGRAREAYLITPDMASLNYLRKMETDNLAKTGDAEKKLLICEWTLVVNNEAAHGVIADLI